MRVYQQIIEKHIFDDLQVREDLDETVRRIEFYRHELEAYAKSMILLINDFSDRRRFYWMTNKDKRLVKWAPDLRTGYESFGYESIESIRNTLLCISDRFEALYIINWMLGIPTEYKKLKD